MCRAGFSFDTRLFPANAVGRHGEGDPFRGGQFEVVHDGCELFLGNRQLQPRVIKLLFSDRRDIEAVVIVTGIDQRFVGKGKQFLSDAVIQRLGRAALKTGPAASANEERIPGKEPKKGTNCSFTIFHTYGAGWLSMRTMAGRRPTSNFSSSSWSGSH